MLVQFKNPLVMFIGLSLFLTASPAFANMKETLADEIANMSLDLSCDNNEQCKSIGLGDKPCGGFQSYKLYSTKTLNDESFTKMVKAYNALDKQQNEKNGMVSTCEMLMQPAVSCVANECKVIGLESGQAPTPY